MLVHGFESPYQIWIDYIEHYKENYHILVPILPGHDVQEKSKFISFDDTAKEIENYCISRLSNNPLKEDEPFQGAFFISPHVRKLPRFLFPQYNECKQRGRSGFAMSNSLAKVHPELVSEWSEKNFRLLPIILLRLKQKSLVERQLRSRMAGEREGSFQRRRLPHMFRSKGC